MRTRPATWPAIRERVMLRDGSRCTLNGPHCSRIATDVAATTHTPRHVADLVATCRTCKRTRGLD